MLTSSRLYAKEFSFDKSCSMKWTIYQKLRHSNGNTFSFIPHVCYFSDTFINRELCIFLVQMLKTVSILFINPEHFIWWSFFQICSESNNPSLLLYACEVFHLINKGVISPYVQQ